MAHLQLNDCIVNDNDFRDIQWGSETKKIRLSIEQQPNNNILDNSEISIGISIWNLNTKLIIKKIEFIRETSNYGHLIATNVESIKSTIYFVIYPLKLNNNYLTNDIIEEDDKKCFSIIKNDINNLLFEDNKLLLLKFNIYKCCTTSLKSPLKILIYLFGNSDHKERTLFTNPISIYQQYHKGADKYLSVLSSTLNGNITRLKKLIIEENKDINQLDNNLSNALHISIIYNHHDCFNFLLEKGININIQDKDKRTALHKSIYYGYNIFTRKLLDNKADINIQDKHGETPLHLSILKNRLLCMEVLLENKPDINIIDKNGLTPLHTICYKNREEYLEILLKYNPDIHIKDKHKNTPLDIALLNGFSNCAKILFNAGGFVTDEYLLHNAAFNGYSECVQLLIDNQIDPNLVDEEISLPIHKAAFNGHNECVKILLDSNVDITACDESGSTPLHLACFSGNIHVISTLLEYSASLDIQDNTNGTPLHNACYNGNSDAVTLLLARGASIDIEDNSGATPLHLAAEKGHFSCVDILLKYKANIEIVDCKQRFPIHYAISNEKCFDLLLKANADINMQDINGDTPLILATKLSYEDMVRYLLKTGASFSTLNYNGKLAINFANEKIKEIFQEEALSENARNDILEIYEEAALKFNQKPKLGIQYLLESKLKKRENENNLQDDINIIIEFLHKHSQHLNRTLVGEYISEPDEKSGDILMSFIEYLDFEDMEFDNALRTFLSKFRLPGEAQKIDRIMEKFAHHYFKQNEKNNIFPTEDQAYLLAFSLIMLNTDLHNPSIKHKMTCEQFVKNNTDTGLEHDLSPEFLGRMYNCIKEKEIKMENEDTTFGNSVAVKMGWMTKQGGRIKTWKRRWFILSDHVLYYFKEKQEETSKACGIVPLEDIIVRHAEDKRKYCFELSHSSDTAMKAMKRHQGQIQKGHHDSYFICASSKKEMEEWMEAISHNNMDNQFKALMEMKFQKAKQHQVSEDLIQFSKLQSAIELCDECYKGKDILKSKYSQVIIEPSYKYINYCMVTHLKHRTHTIVIVGCKWTNINDIKNLSKKKTNFMESYGLLQIAKTIRRTLQKNFQKDFKIKIIGHSLGGNIGVFIAQLLYEKNIKVTDVICFGSPRVFTQSQVLSIKETNIPIIQVINILDHITCLFPKYYSVGSRLVLLNGAHYCWLEKPKENEIEPSMEIKDLIDTSLDNNNINIYIESIKEKVGLSVAVQYHLRSHYL